MEAKHFRSSAILVLGLAGLSSAALPFSSFHPAFAHSPMQLRGLGLSTLRHGVRALDYPRRNLEQARRGRSGVGSLKATIASLYQAKGRTEDALKEIADLLARKKYTLDIQAILALEAERKAVQAQVDQSQQERNSKSKSIGQLKAKGQDVSQIMHEVEGLKAKLQAAENQMKVIEDKFEEILLSVPNAPNPAVPAGKDEVDNVEKRKWGTPKQFDFPVKDHVDVGAFLNGMDFALASKITGTRFVLLQGPVALMHRALVQYMLDTHTQKHGYTELYVPYIVNADSLRGTGQLPKFKEDLFALTKTQDKDFYLIPTAEVPVTNIIRDTITPAEQLPLRFTAHTPCFRSEAGSYGRDTRGLIRQHQFEKVEMVQVVAPQTSYAALEEMTGHAEAILQGLGLPYRVIELCTGDLGFSAAKTYDIEVWLPAQGTYREISSCSNCEDFQARRMMARWRNPETKSNELVHTLNGSGLAVGRTLVAILENFQQADGSVEIPPALRPYMGGITHMRPLVKEGAKEPAHAKSA